MAKRILVVEDVKNIRNIVAYALRNRGYEVLEATDGDEAWETLNKEPIDLLVIDAMLPGRTGFDICDDLKRDKLRTPIPILMLTAMRLEADHSDEYGKKKLQADDFLIKPFQAQELIRRIDLLMNKTVNMPQTA